MAMIDPTPRHNSNRPRVPSLSWARALAYGTSGAGTMGAGLGMAVMENPWFCVQRTMSGATSLHIKPHRASQVHAGFTPTTDFIFSITERSGRSQPPRGHRTVGGVLEGA